MIIPIKKFTAEEIYSSVLTSRFVENENGWMQWQAVERTIKPTGSAILDSIVSVLHETRLREAKEFGHILQVDPALLRPAVKLLTGMTFAQFILSYRLQQAKEWLSCTNLSLTEISERCGFPSQQVFSQYFTQSFHVSPQKFRQYNRPANFASLYKWE